MSPRPERPRKSRGRHSKPNTKRQDNRSANREHPRGGPGRKEREDKSAYTPEKRTAQREKAKAGRAEKSPSGRQQGPITSRRKPPNKEILNQMLQQCGIRLPPGPLDALWKYHHLLREHNTDRDLTRLIGFESIVLKHYVDSMIIGHFVRLPSPLADIGTGAGFPGIPLKIRYPGIDLVLVEPRPRRVAFLETVRDNLGLKNVTVVPHKATAARLDVPVNGIITRALEPIAETLQRVSTALNPGGLAIFMKGPAGTEEIQPALDSFGDEYSLVKDKPYDLPGTDHHRRLIILKRKG